MGVQFYDYVTVQGDYITADLLVWRRYRNTAPGIVEKLLDANPHLAKIHQTTPFLPVGTQVRIPIDLNILRGKPTLKPITNIWGK